MRKRSSNGSESPRTAPSARSASISTVRSSRTGGRVTFEVLMAAFELSDNHALARVGMIVHYLDVGGVETPEAAGLAAIAAGLRAEHTTDDAYLAAMTPVFDALV